MPGAEVFRVRLHIPIPKPTPGSGKKAFLRHSPVTVSSRSRRQTLQSSIKITFVFSSWTFSECDLHDHAVPWTLAEASGVVGLLAARRGPCSSAAAVAGGRAAATQAGAAQASLRRQRHQSLFQLLLKILSVV